MWFMLECLQVLMNIISNVVGLGELDYQLNAFYFTNTQIKNMLFKLFQKQGDITNQMSSVNELINFLEDPVQC